MLDQHPVPQNVTTFQFRLVGDMTLKQFGYLAAGAILAYISYNLPLPFFFRYPLTALFALGGIGFAFVPIEERPMDVWFLSFVRSIYSPTQYVWQREQHNEKAATDPMAQLASFTNITKAPSLSAFSSLLSKKKQDQGQGVPQKPTPQAKAKTPQGGHMPTSLQTILDAITPHAQAKPTPAYVPGGLGSNTVLASTPVRVGGTQEKPTEQAGQAGQTTQAPTPSTPQQVAQPSYVPEEKIQPQGSQSPTPAQNNANADDRIKKLEEQMNRLHDLLKDEQSKNAQLSQVNQKLQSSDEEKKRLASELEAMKKNLESQPPQSHMRVAQPSDAQNPDAVTIITPDAAKSAGLPTITTVPNVITGIVRERSGNLLTGILVTVKDKNDVPVRALKTNKLGQFAASTPLPQGEYMIEVEDPRGNVFFDNVKAILTNQVLPPVEIIAKTKQELERQKLEKALFGDKVT